MEVCILHVYLYIVVLTAIIIAMPSIKIEHCTDLQYTYTSTKLVLQNALHRASERYNPPMGIPKKCDNYRKNGIIIAFLSTSLEVRVPCAYHRQAIAAAIAILTRVDACALTESGENRQFQFLKH